MTTGVIAQGKVLASNNVKAPLVVSAALGSMLAGVVVYFAAKSGVKSVQKAATVAKGGK